MYEDIKNAEPNDILISHFPLSEGATDSGLKVTTRFSAKDLKKFKLVLLGDYHTHQTVGHIHYPGTLIPMNKGEKGAKGFIVFDDKTLKTEFVEVTGFRKYIDVEITDTTNAKDLKKIINEAKDSNDFITVRNTLEELPKEFKTLVKDVPVIDEFEPEEFLRGISSSMQLGEQLNKYLEIKNVPESDRNKYIQIGLTALGT
jgi:DNA repair exonuclease SbcCD nuclease subunit